MTKNCGADPHMGRTECHRRGEVRAHAHGQELQPVALRDLRGEREMRRGRFVGRRNTHQPCDRKPIGFTAGLEERIGRFRQHAGLLRLGAGVDLHEQGRRAALLGDLLGQGLAERGAVDGVDGIEQRHRLLRLVRLQRADQMECNIGVALLQRRPFGPGLLDAVFAEYALSRRDHLCDGIDAERLRDRNQRHIGRIALRVAAGVRDLTAHGRKTPAHVVAQRGRSLVHMRAPSELVMRSSELI